MDITVLNLGNGQLPNSSGVLYTVPLLTSAIVQTIILVNTNTVSETVDLYYIASGGTARRIIQQSMVLSAGQQFEMDTNITMGASDAIKGAATDASKVDYVISGVQIT